VTTGYYLLDNPNPNAPGRGDGQYWGYASMNSAPRCVVMHTAESVADVVGDDLGAENVARYFTTTTADRAASYHTVVDSDSTVRCLPAGLDETTAHTAFHAYGVNSWCLGLSLAMRADSWPTVPQAWASKILNRAVNEAAAWCARWGIPAARITFTEAQAGGKGFMAHADTSPTDRSDPGAGFPWDLFLRLVAAQLDLGGSSVDPTPKDDPMPTHLLRLPSGAVIAAFASGALRTIGGAEFNHFTAAKVPMLTVTDANEASQLTWQAHPFAIDVRRIADATMPAPAAVVVPS
jgi:hypothetical protein